MIAFLMFALNLSHVAGKREERVRRHPTARPSMADNGCKMFVFTCSGKEALLLPTYPRTTWLCMERTRHSMAAPGQPSRDADNPVLQQYSRKTHNNLTKATNDKTKSRLVVSDVSLLAINRVSQGGWRCARARVVVVMGCAASVT